MYDNVAENIHAGTKSLRMVVNRGELARQIRCSYPTIDEFIHQSVAQIQAPIEEDDLLSRLWLLGRVKKLCRKRSEATQGIDLFPHLPSSSLGLCENFGHSKLGKHLMRSSTSSDFETSTIYSKLTTLFCSLANKSTLLEEI